MKDLVVAVVADGTPEFTADDGPGKDSGPKNNIVRSLDTVDYEVSWQVTKDGDYTLEAELPAGVEFAPGSDSFCKNAGKAISNDLTYQNKNTLRCELTGMAGQSVKSAVKVFVRRAANGSVIPLQFTAGGATSNKVSTTMSAKPDFTASMDGITAKASWETISGNINSHSVVHIESPRPDSGLNKGLEALSGDYRVEIPVTAPEGTIFTCATDRVWGYPREKYGSHPDNSSLRNSGECGEVTVTDGKVVFTVTGADLTASSWPIRDYMDRAWNRNIIAFVKLYYTVPADKATGDTAITLGKAQIYATTLSGAEYPITSATEPFTRPVIDASQPVLHSEIHNQWKTPDYYAPGYAISKEQPVGITFASWFPNSGNLKNKHATLCAMFPPDQLNVVKVENEPAEYYRGDADSMADGFSCGMFGDGTEGWSSDATDMSDVKAVRVKGRWPISLPQLNNQNASRIDMSMIRSVGDTSAIGTQLPIRFMVTADGQVVANESVTASYHSSYFTAVDGTFGLNPAWDKADGLFGQVRNLNLGFTAKDGLTEGTVAATLPACLKVTNPGTSGTLTPAAADVNREDCSVPGDTVSFPVVDGNPNYVVQAQVVAKSPQTGTTKVILDSSQQPLSEVRRSKSISFTTGLVEQATASVSTSAPDNVVTLENGTASIPLTLSWGNATTGDAMGELVWQVPENVTLASVGEVPGDASVQCTTQDRGQVTTALAADKSGKTLTWVACPTETAALAAVTAVKVSTGTLASTATGTLPVNVTANQVGDVNTSFTAGVFTTTGDGKVEFSEATPLSVYVREPAPADTVTEGEWEDATDQNAKNCDTKQVTQTRTVTTTPHKWDAGSKTWVADPEHATTKTETQTRAMSDEELQVCTPKPADDVKTAEWVDGTGSDAKNCAAKTVSQTRSKTTTPYKWDTVSKTWVLDADKVKVESETQTRPMTDTELMACAIRPADKVDTTEWVDSTDEGAKDCQTGKVKQSRTVTTTSYKWDAATKTWVADTDKARVVTESQVRDMTDSELQECTVNPGLKAEETEWTDSTDAGAKDCQTRKVTQTRTVTTTPYKWDSVSKKWVLDTENVTSKTETQTRDMNEDEVKVCMAGTGVPTYPDPTPVPPGGKIIIDPINGPDNPAQCEPTGPVTRADGVVVTVDKDCKVTITIPEGKNPGELTPPVEVTPKYPTPDKPVVTVPVKVVDTPDWDDGSTTPGTPVTIEKRKGEVPEGTTTQVTGPGTAVLNPDGSITVTPNEGATPGEKITVKVVDKVGNPLDEVTVTITEPKPAPDWDDAITGPGKKVDVPNKGGDVPPGTTVTVNGPGSAVLNPDGSITVTPNGDAKPGEKITITVNDGKGKELDSFTVKIGKPKATTKNLPVTGATTAGMAGLAVALMLAGGLIAWQRRRN
ncbi:Ig-like domain-containing protein [Actinotignum sp. GS-2025b]|uniref:Ig-like domain-containing protein n=1 Tax=Actinotignum sp. GS-2025b TaxID=3427275 RepID=UPI003F45CAAF